MSHTPRTEDELRTSEGTDGIYFEYVSVEFARKLERELAECRKELERAKRDGMWDGSGDW